MTGYLKRESPSADHRQSVFMRVRHIVSDMTMLNLKNAAFCFYVRNPEIMNTILKL